ncbi:MAG TPA: hypothetical protein VIV60_29250 [Polyangiaceae bacterium]
MRAATRYGEQRRPDRAFARRSLAQRRGAIDAAQRRTVTAGAPKEPRCIAVACAPSVVQLGRVHGGNWANASTLPAPQPLMIAHEIEQDPIGAARSPRRLPMMTPPIRVDHGTGVSSVGRTFLDGWAFQPDRARAARGRYCRCVHADNLAETGDSCVA